MKTRAFAALLAASLIAVPALASPAGMAAHVQGPVQAVVDGKTVPVRLLQRLEPGTQVKVGAGGEAVIVLFANSSRFKIGSGQTGTVNATGVSGGQKLADLSGPSAGVVQKLGGSRAGAVVSRKVSNTLQRLSPTFAGYVESPTPNLSWQATSGAKSYTITIFDSYDNVLWSTRTEGAGATYNAPVPLTPNKPYLWRLTAYGSSGKPLESRSGLLTVLSPSDAAELRQQEAALKQEMANSTDSIPQLLLAAAYQTFGVYGRSLEILDDLVLRGEPGATEARSALYQDLSPVARVLAGQAVEPEK